MYKEITLNSFDNYPLCIHIFEASNPKAVIQFAHGMEEHQERYECFFAFLKDNGFTVISNDLRGHGKTASKQGYFAKENGDKALINDQETMLNYIKQHYPTLPIYIFAHSFGTIIMRVYLQTHSMEYEKVILSGYSNYTPAVKVGMILAKCIEMTKGEDYRSKFLTSISTDSFSKKIKNKKTNFDWLSYNEDNVLKYMNDPLCGQPFTISGYKTLFALLDEMHKSKYYKDVNSKLEFLLISGEDDPVVGGEKGIKDSIATLDKAGFKNIRQISLAKMRHEMLFEDKKDDVYNTIISFLNETLKN